MDVVFGIVGLLIMLAILGGICLGVFFLFKKMFGIAGGKTSGKDKNTFNLKDLSDSLIFRIGFACILILVSLIPLKFVEEIIDERSNLYSSVSQRMTQEWSGYQQISGPILSIPYEYTDYVTEKVENKKTGEVTHKTRPVKRTKNLLILPENVNVQSRLETRELTRGIYTVPIYESKHTVNGGFAWPDLSVLANAPEQILWERAILTFMISSTKGITGNTQLKWNGVPVNLSAGTGVGIQKGGIHARLKLDGGLQEQPANFSLSLNLRGSRGLNFAPTGRNSNIQLNANWPDPSFVGELLPTARDIKDESFSANWDVAHLSRSYGQLAAYNTNTQKGFYDSVTKFNFGANLFQTVDLYTLLDRTVKYGALFIALTFFTLFVVEFASGIRFHWLQHLVIGGALSMFYLCVLALSEHIAFAYAYLSGVVIIGLMVGLYTRALTGRFFYGFCVGGVMASLYAVLYSILQMEDFALLIGTLLLLIFLGIGMFITRKLHQK